MTKKTQIMIIVAVLALAVSGCSRDEKKVVVASKPMTEQFIIAEMLVTLIEQETDISVEHKAGIGGGTSNIHPAMLNGEIDIYPEYTGTGWMFVLQKDLINNPDLLFQEVKSAYLERYNIVWSELYGFNDTFGLAMKKDTARKYGIKSYSDLARLSENFVFGSEHDFLERDDGFPGIDERYNFNFKKEVGMDIGLKYQAIESGGVDVINIFSTDALLQKYEMIVLEDDLNFFPSYFAASLVRQETLEKYPELAGVLSMLDGIISTEEMTSMNYQVLVERLEPKDVAEDFLRKKGLLTK